MDDTLTASLLQFFDGLPTEAALGCTITDWLLSTLPAVKVRVQKTQITFRNRYNFAALSLPRRKQDRQGHALLLTLGLPRPLDSPRVLLATEPYPNRLTHHLRIVQPEALDGELLGWIREAYDFANAKGRGAKNSTCSQP